MAIQAAAPFIHLLRKKQLVEIIARAIWGPILPGYPPAWFGRTHGCSSDASRLDKKVQTLGLATERSELVQPWERFQSDIVAIKHLAKHVLQWDGSLQDEVLKAIQHLEEVDFLVFSDPEQTILISFAQRHAFLQNAIIIIINDCTLLHACICINLLVVSLFYNMSSFSFLVLTFDFFCHDCFCRLEPSLWEHICLITHVTGKGGARRTSLIISRLSYKPKVQLGSKK